MNGCKQTNQLACVGSKSVARTCCILLVGFQLKGVSVKKTLKFSFFPRLFGDGNALPAATGSIVDNAAFAKAL